MPKLRALQYVCLVGVVLMAVIQPSSQLGMTPVVGETLGQDQSPTAVPPKLVVPAPIPIYQGELPAEQTFPVVKASAVYVMDRASGSILFEKNQHETRYPASTAKMLTALVVRKLYSLDEVLLVQQEAFTTGTIVGFQMGERLTVRDLLYALLVSSGNDAAFILANHHPLGYQGFVEEMNRLAQELHLSASVFRNPSGLDSQDQFSTARDLAILAHELMKDEFLRQVVGTPKITIANVDGEQQHVLTTTHHLIGAVAGVVGVKTGTTEFAGENLITEVDRDGHQVIIVLLGSEDRFAETEKIIEWIFSQYRWETVPQALAS